MKDITIFENFINDEELEEVRQFIGDKLVLKPGIHKPNSQVNLGWRFNSEDNCYKKILFYLPRHVVSRLNPTVGMEDIIPSLKNFILKIKNKIDKCMNTNFEIQRIYLNRQVRGQDVSLHTDDSNPNTYTLLIYIGDITPENYDKAGGDLEIKTKEITRIEPFTKRAVLFKGYIPHQAYAPLVPDITRISLAFKLIDSSKELPFMVKYT